MTGQAVCGSLIQDPDHLRSHHGVGGPDKVRLVCCWTGCFAEMKKRSLMKNVDEKHLEIKHACPNCHGQFPRSYNSVCMLFAGATLN